MYLVVEAVLLQGGVVCKENIGFKAQSLDIEAFTLWMRTGWKSCLGSRVEMTTCMSGNVEAAFSITLLRAVDTQPLRGLASKVLLASCLLRRLFVPVWIMMWLGSHSFSCLCPD